MFRRVLLDRFVTVVAFIAFVTLLVFLFLIQRRNARMGLRTPSIFVPNGVER